MIPGILTLLFLISEIESVQCSLGVPVTIDYSIPEDFTPRPVEVTDSFILLEQQGDSIRIIPMVLDTLLLPDMHAVSDAVEREFPPPVLVVARTMPDTTWNVPVFPSPLSHTIPPGVPQDYLERHCFWEKWGKAPSNWWLLPAVFLLALALTLAFIRFRYRKRRILSSSDDSDASNETLSPLDEVRALLHSKAFVEGRWPEYYMNVDRLLRNTVSVRFGISNRANTWHQIRRQLSVDKSGRKFTDDSAELAREIALQRYAAWGGSRERAKRYTSILLTLREEWHRQ